MMRVLRTSRLSLFALFVVLGSANAQNQTTPKTGYDYVDPLIGTVNGGHVFPGATLPFGMAKAVADVNGENQGGFASDGSDIIGFSHMHDSGTGGSPSLGNFPIFAQSGCPGDDINKCKFSPDERATGRINGTVEARPGYFAITLNTTIHAEMTVTNHTALYRFTFPKTPIEPNTTLNPLILVDLADLPNSRIQANVQVDNTTGRLSGSGEFQPSFGIGSYKSYFCVDFSGAPLRDTGIFSGIRAGPGSKLRVQQDGVNNSPQILPGGAWARFQAPTSNNQLLVRVGLSFISEAKACSNAENEIPAFDFSGTLQAAENAWKGKLGVIGIEAGGASEELQTTFWSGVYRSMISPQDYTGENQLWNSTEPYYDSFYCIWDSFRSIHPLITLLDPYSQTQMLRTLIDVFRHEGKLPDCRMSFCKGFTQGGSNADILLADAWVKNLTQGIDWGTAYRAIISDAEDEPANWAVEGRGGLESWKRLGYIPTDDYDILGVGPQTRSISRTVEYAYNDFCIAEIAKGMGKTQDYQKYIQRSLNWKNMFRADQTSFLNGTDTGFVGFLQPRYLNQTWGYQDPAFCSPLMNFTSCYLNPDGHETYEGSAWLYSFFAPHTMADLVTTLGGNDTFVKRLDYIHDSGLLYVGDEQAFLLLFLYHYAGRPALSAKRTRYYIPSQFNDTLPGIAGNDDSGAMGSFTTLTMMGIFPNPGQDVYFITPPFFEEVRLRYGLTNKTATIRNKNFDPSGQAIYIQNATLNGKPYTKNWLQHSFFTEGGTLELELGTAESKWGTKLEDLPPSLVTG